MKKHGILLAFLGIASLTFAQKIKITDGDLTPLKSIKEFNIEYDYSDMSVGKYDKEEEYLSKKQEEYNEKEAGKGDKWRESWVNDRKNRFEPSFEELLNKYLDGKKVESNPNAEYTIILHTTHTEPGFNVFVTKKPAEIRVTITIVETANRDNVICTIESSKNLGRTYGLSDMDTGVRISEAYADCGKALAKFFTKNWK